MSQNIIAASQLLSQITYHIYPLNSIFFIINCQQDLILKLCVFVWTTPVRWSEMSERSSEIDLIWFDFTVNKNQHTSSNRPPLQTVPDLLLPLAGPAGCRAGSVWPYWQQTTSAGVYMSCFVLVCIQTLYRRRSVYHRSYTVHRQH